VPFGARPHCRLAAGPLFVICFGMSVMLEIPESAVAGLHLSPEQLQVELRRDLAVVLYARGALPISKAMEFAGMNRRDFERLLKERQVRRPFDETELTRELRDPVSL